MTYLIDDIAQYLVTEGLGTLSTNIFKSFMPDSADNALSILDTGGPMPDPDIPTHSPTFQVFIRASNYALGKAKLDAVRNALHRLGNEQIGDTYFYYILAQSEGGHIGRNERGLDEFSINFICKTR
jgi:hypothetical protein